jgi:hypothetical protein
MRIRKGVYVNSGANPIQIEDTVFVGGLLEVIAQHHRMDARQDESFGHAAPVTRDSNPDRMVVVSDRNSWAVMIRL